MASGELTRMSAVELRRHIGNKSISPVELLEACIERIETINPSVNAIAGKGYERARKEAKMAEAAVLNGDELGPLHGLPVGIKDLQDTEGLLTTYGSPLYRDHIPAKDSAQVALLRKAGAIVTAKTNVPEFGAGANTRNVVWGATGNPFDPSLNAGGSSGGSAVALAMDMLPLCSGSDTGGSLRIPAAICGVVGVRPSPGLVPMDANNLGWSPISVLGPMGRDVSDARLLFAAQVGFDDRDPLSQVLESAAVNTCCPVDLSRMRVAWTTNFGKCPIGGEIAQVMRERMATMSHFFAVCDELEFDFGRADDCFDIVRALMFIARYKDVYDNNPGKLGPNVRANCEIGASMSLADVAWAHKEQTHIFRNFQRIYRDYDIIMAPTTPVSPFPWTQLYLEELNGEKLRNYYHWLALTYYITLVANPVIVIPCGCDHKGMPFGIQLVGRFQGDVELFDVTQSLENALDGIDGFGRLHPDVHRYTETKVDLKAIVTSPPPL